MLNQPQRVRVFAYRQPVDMRKAYDTLSALAFGSMKKSLLSGDVFAFIGRTRKRAKAMWTGLVLFLDDPSIPLDNNGTERA